MRPAMKLTIGTVIACLVTAVALPLLAQQPPPAEGTEADLIAVLQSDAPLFDKAKACQQLAVTGTKQCVPVLAKLLSDQQLSHYARFALEPIPDPSVDDALRNALGELEGRHLVGTINSIGIRRDAKAVGDLTKLLGNSDAAVAAAASAALGRIHTFDAVVMLLEALKDPQPLRTAVGDACLTAGDMLLSESPNSYATAVYDTMRQADLPAYQEIAALYGAIRARGPAGLPMLAANLRAEDKALFRVALRMAQELSGDEVAEALVEELPKLDSAVRQALVIHVLGNRGDKAALPVVLEVAKSGSADVRLPALRVLAKLGDVSAVPVLLATAVEMEGELAEAARDSLAKLPGEQIDRALAAKLSESEGKMQLTLIDLVGQRGIASAVSALMTLADSDDPAVRAAAIGALGLTVGPDDLPALIGRLVAAETPELAAEVKDSLRKACMRSPDRDACAGALLAPMSKASATAKGDLLDLLGVVGGAKSLEGVAAAANSDSEPLQDAATRVLGEWMSPDAAPVLLELAKSGNAKFKVRALRGYIRIPRQLDVPLETRVAMCRQVIDVAQRDDEKKLALEVLARYPSTTSLSLAAESFATESLKEAAVTAAVLIAEKIVKAHPAAVAETMKDAMQATSDAELAKRARRMLNRANANLKQSTLLEGV